MTLTEIFNSIQNQFIKAPKTGPFRLFNFSTIANNAPQSRMVVTRGFEDNTFVFYSDIRAEKVSDIKKNKNCFATFYCHETMVQIRCKTTARIYSGDNYSKEHWEKTSDFNKICYATELAPGSILPKRFNPETMTTSLNMYESFCVIKLQIESYDYLKIENAGHIRAQFDRNTNWQGDWLVP